MGEQHWKSCGNDDTGCGDALYIVADQNATERISLGNDAWLLVHVEDGVVVTFAVFEFCMGSATRNGVEVEPMKHTILFHGSGPSGSLRECRHIWWGENGYTYYADFALIEAALRELRRWFDGD